MERDSKFLKKDPTREQRLAGIDQLNKFGEVKLLDALANGDLLKWEQVTKISYDEVFMKLYYDTDVSKFQDRLSEVYRQQSKRK